MTFQQLARPKVGAPHRYSFPGSHAQQLANGLTVRYFDLAGQHVIDAQLVLNVPLSAEPYHLEGIAQLALLSADDGTLSRPGTKTAEALDDQGAQFDGHVTHAATIARLSVPATRLRPALGVFAEIIREPAYADEDVYRHIELRRADIAQELINSARAARRAFHAAVFSPNARLSRPVGGQLASLANITAAGLRDFHDRYWRPANATLIIAGELPDAMSDLVEAAFGSWSGDRRELIAAPNPPNQHRQVAIVHRPGAVQADLRIGCYSIDRSDPRWAPMQVASCAVGGFFLSRLNRVLREEHGYTYGAHFLQSPLTTGGSQVISATFRTEVAAAATAQTLRLLNLADAPLSDHEVARAQNYLLGVAPLRYDTAAAIAGQAAALACVGLEPSFVDDFHHGVAETSTWQANDAFTELVRPDQCHIILCGDADVLAPQLAAHGLNAKVIELQG